MRHFSFCNPVLLAFPTFAWTAGCVKPDLSYLSYIPVFETDLQKTPDSQENAKLRILLNKHMASNSQLVLDFVSGSGAPDKQSRETFIAIRNDLKRTALASVPGLDQTYGSIVHREGLSEADFWRHHQQLLVDAGLLRRKVRVSSRYLKNDAFATRNSVHPMPYFS